MKISGRPEDYRSPEYGIYPYEEILRRVDRAYGKRLTETEKVVTVYILYGQKRREIAQTMGISYETVKWHLSNIYKKLGIASKYALKTGTENMIFSIAEPNANPFV